jgi:RNA ligase
MAIEKAIKPLGRKAYGSIPHLPSSRMGPADHSCHIGQYNICCVTARDKHDRVIVTEKLDGACMSVANVGGKILAIGRAGYLASDAPFDHIQKFGDWVARNEKRFLDVPVGFRIIGEWIAMAHGTTYKIHNEPFVAFDLMKDGKRFPHDEARSLFKQMDLKAAHVVSDGPPIEVELAIEQLGTYGFHNAQEQVEGAVWRVERKGEFDFMAKWVRPDKVDGKYLPDISGEPAIWNFAS